MIITPLLFALALAATPQAAPQPPSSLAAPAPDATRLENGLAYRVERPGNGSEKPAVDDFARIRVTVWSSDGELIQHVEPPKSVVIRLSNMLPGWRMTVSEMVAGEVRRAWIPASLGAGKIDDGEMFVIDTELVEILRPHIAPPDVAAAPSDAATSESGLAWVVLEEGDGGERPGRRSHVTVHYTGWTTDGQMFDSSIVRGEPTSFPLTRVIAGWTEGLQMMTRGEKRRFWIPARLAYGNDRTKPQGMLVFEIELIDFR